MNNLPSTPFAIQAKFVFPIGSFEVKNKATNCPVTQGEVIENGTVQVAAGKITYVGPTALAPKVKQVFDLGAALLLPGFVNAHTHLEFSDLKKPLGKPNSPFPTWISEVIAERQRRKSQPAEAIAAGVTESLRFGVTTLGEIATAPVSEYRRLTLRPDMVWFAEVIGFSRQRAEASFDAVQERLQIAEQLKAEQQTAAAQSGYAGPEFLPSLSPHAPYTVGHRLLKNLITKARELDLPVAMHLAESPEEIELITKRSGPFRELLASLRMWDQESIPSGARPLDYLQMLAKAPRSLVVHGNYLSDEEYAWLAAHSDRMTLVHCPRTHAYFGHPRFPLGALLEKGVTLAIGTDSRASNPDLSILSELQLLSELHPEVSPKKLLELATICGAKGLGLEHQVGSLEVGKYANVVAFSVAEDEPLENVLATLLTSKKSTTKQPLSKELTTKKKNSQKENMAEGSSFIAEKKLPIKTWLHGQLVE